MRMLLIEIRKEKRTGAIPVLLAVGILGALYAWVSFIIRKESLFSMPLDPMDILLTQLYGMIMMLNMFGIIVAACILYNMEFSGNAVKKMYMLPINVADMYLCKFIILSVTFMIALLVQNFALYQIGISQLPKGAFVAKKLIDFALYSLITSMPVLGFMLLAASCFENIWMTLGIGVGGFLSGMALATSSISFFVVHPFVAMLKPAVAMSTQPDTSVINIACIETILFLGLGLWRAKKVRYE